MERALFSINGVPAVLLGEEAESLYLFIHGKSGCKEEAEDLARIVCPRAQVLGVDLPEHGARKGERDGFDPWHAVPELRAVMAYARARWGRISLRANSIGAWFSMLAFADDRLEKSLFVSPILDMAELIRSMMQWASVSEARLEAEKTIPTEFGETLSWRYYTYANEHPIRKWDSPTAVLYAGGDTLTPRSTVESFCTRFGCGLTVMEDGEHWFHTPEQISVLERWTKENF